MTGWIRHLHHRELRFLGLIGLTGAIIALYLGAGLRLAGEEGTGWRTIDLDTLQRRVETGELRDREADWYHSSTPEEISSSGGRK
jgi:hypothetical protein